MLKVKLQFGHLVQRAGSLKKIKIWERLRAGEEEGDQNEISITSPMDMSLSKLGEIVAGQGGLACCCARAHKESDTT